MDLFPNIVTVSFFGTDLMREEIVSARHYLLICVKGSGCVFCAYQTQLRVQMFLYAQVQN